MYPEPAVSYSTNKLPQQLQTKLLTFNQRTLNKGEVFLLAKAISDAIPIPKEGDVNVSIHNLNHRNFMLTVIGKLEGYVFVSSEVPETIYRLVNDFVSWRYAVANGICVSNFTGESNNFVDDVTGILRYVNMSDFADGCTIAENAGYTYSIFKELVASVK